MNSRKSMKRIGIDKHILRDYFLIFLGATVQAVGMRLFLIPGQLVSGGISGAAQIVHFYTKFPIGIMVIVGNIPLYMIGWRHLGGIKFALRTFFSVLIFSFITDLFPYIFPIESITNDILLNTLYGALFLGAGLGLVYLGRGTSGGSDILGRILNYRFGLSISAAYLITDSFVVLASGFAFGWEKALYSLLVIYMSGEVAETVSEGSSIVRTILIITDKPTELAAEFMKELERGVTYLYGKGAYTGTDHTMLYCIVSRPEVSLAKGIIGEIDPDAFVVIGQANEVLGEGFRPLKKIGPVKKN